MTGMKGISSAVLIAAVCAVTARQAGGSSVSKLQS